MKDNENNFIDVDDEYINVENINETINNETEIKNNKNGFIVVNDKYNDFENTHDSINNEPNIKDNKKFITEIEIFNDSDTQKNSKIIKKEINYDSDSKYISSGDYGLEYDEIEEFRNENFLNKDDEDENFKEIYYTNEDFPEENVTLITFDTNRLESEVIDLNSFLRNTEKYDEADYLIQHNSSYNISIIPISNIPELPNITAIGDINTNLNTDNNLFLTDITFLCPILVLVLCFTYLFIWFKKSYKRTVNIIEKNDFEAGTELMKV